MSQTSAATPLLSINVNKSPVLLQNVPAQPSSSSLGERTVVAVLPNEVDPIMQAVCDIIDDLPLDDPQTAKRLRFRVTVACFSAATKVVFWPVFNELPGGPAWGLFGSMGWFAFENWAAQRIANQCWAPRLARDDVVIIPSQQPKSKLVSSAIIAGISKAPVVMIAYEYTKAGPVVKLLAATTTLISTSMVPTLSTMSTLNLFRDHCCSCLVPPMEELRGKMLAMRSAVCGLLETNQRAFTRMSIRDKLGIVQSYLAIRDVAQMNDRAGRFLELMLARPAMIQHPSTARVIPKKCPPRSTLISWGSGIVSTLLTGLSQGLMSTYSFYKAQEFIYENDYFGAALASLVFASGVYVSWNSSYRTNVSLVTAAANAACSSANTTDRELAWELYPVATGILSVLGGLSTVAAAAYYWPVWADFCQDHEEWEGFERFAQISTCAPLVLVIANCMLDLIPGVVKFVGEKMGSKNKKDILVFHKMHTKLKDVFLNLRFLNWCMFVSKNCPANLKQELLAKYQVADAALTKLIQEHSPEVASARSSPRASSKQERS